MNCERCKERLSEFEAGELAAEAAEAVQAHLDECDACAQLLAALRSTDQMIHELADDEPPSSLCLRILARVDEHFAPDTAEMPDIMTPEQLARFLHLPLDKLETEGLPGFEIGGVLRFRRDRVLEWIEERERDYERSRIYAKYSA